MQNFCENLIMKEKFKTSIHITGPAIEAYQRLIRRYSAKLAVSAALYAFEKINAEDQLRFIDHVSGQQITSLDPRQRLKDTIAQIKEMTEIEQQQPGTIYRVLDKEEQKVLDEFRKLVGSGEKKKSRSA